MGSPSRLVRQLPEIIRMTRQPVALYHLPDGAFFASSGSPATSPA
jgi:hypothetical protein